MKRVAERMYLTEDGIVDYIRLLTTQLGGARQFSMTYTIDLGALQDILDGKMMPPLFLIEKLGFRKQSIYVLEV